jgi:SAM-dependent methyltransferase
MTEPVSDRTCPVCRNGPAHRFIRVGARAYWRCHTCMATFLDPGQLPDRAEERACDLHHENDPDDPRYRRFLGRLAEPLLPQLPPGSEGLDYGCGPGPALAAMLEEAGHRMTLFDPFFRPETAVLARSYDFITCTETIEHFHDPAAEFDRLSRMLRPGGWLGLMTCFQTDDGRFANWHHRRDPTHVVFYRAQTLRHVAQQRGWECIIPAKDVALMRVVARA